jgi:hypothetical protein
MRPILGPDGVPDCCGVIPLDEATCFAEIGEAIRALEAVPRMLHRPGDDADPVFDAMTALEAARTARAHVSKVVLALTEHALGLGASFRSLGFEFTDPYE